MTSARVSLGHQQADVSARKTYDLTEEPSGAEYRSLLDCSLAYCRKAIVVTGPGDLSAHGRTVLSSLEPFGDAPGASGIAGRRRMLRFDLTRESLAVVKESADRLYAWRQPELPADLSLLRADGAPWLVTISEQRLGYLELTPLEKLVLARSAPGVGAALAHQGAKDARLAVFERLWEGRLEALFQEMFNYSRAVMDESREGVIDALRDWITSDEQGRVSVALELIGALRLPELRDEVDLLLQSVEREEYPVPVVYDRNEVLRDRWKARYRRQLRRVLRSLDASRL